jgi:hypothetical protein
MENVAPFLGEARGLNAPSDDCANANHVGADALVRQSVKTIDPQGGASWVHQYGPMIPPIWREGGNLRS